MHTVLHIGAGNASELPEFLNSGAEKIILVEPNPDLAKQLRQRTAQHPEVSVVEAAITSSSASNQLQEFNLPEACSLHPVTGLNSMFPGLKVNSTHTVETLSPEQFLSEHVPHVGQRALLAIQAPGEEHAILQALIKTDQLKQFSELHVNANPKPYYQGSVAAESTLQALIDYGYEITDENQQDPDWPCWKLVRNPLKDQLVTLLDENEALKADAEKQKDELKKNQLEKEGTRNQLEQLQAEATRQQSDLEQKEEQVKILNASNQHYEQKLRNSLRAQAENENTLAEQQQQLAEKSEQLSSLRNSLEKQKTDAAEQQKMLEQTRSRLDDTGKKLEKNHKAMVEAQSAYHEVSETLLKEKADHQSATNALEEKNQKIQSLKSRSEELKRSTEQLTDKSEEYKQLIEKQRTELIELKKQNEQLKDKLGQESDARLALTEELDTSKKELVAQKSTNSKFEDLEKKIANVSSNLMTHLDKKLINAAKQIENTLGLQDYFNTGELPLSHYGWPISPDLALFLTEKIETENYDLIIEFGSGTSTVLFAKVLRKKMLKQQAMLDNQRSDDSDVTPYSQELSEGATPSSDIDLSHRVLTFEHNTHYQEQTAAMLRRAGLEEIVNLVHAPLVDYSYQGEDYLYYDCDLALARIAEQYEGRAPRVLVLVDGPPGPTGPNARFPAVPKIVNVLSKAKLEIVMDDYIRQEEKHVFEEWKKILSKRGAEFSEIILNFEKGACVLKVG